MKAPLETQPTEAQPTVARPTGNKATWFAGCFFALALVVGATSSADAPVVPATGIDLSAYAGKWFEIRSIPNFFQKGCTNTTAQYQSEPSGTIQVVNKCKVVDDSGLVVKDSSVTGRAWIKNSDNSVLKVSFACPLGRCIETFGGDYWILHVGPVGSDGLYSWAIVGSPSREYAWVLSRISTLDTVSMVTVEALLRRQGYDPAALVMTPQD